jgi:hypothetical protein
MIVRTFTGPTRLSENQVEFVENTINGLMDTPDEVRTGAAEGLDTIAAWLQWFEYPEARHKLFVPSAYRNAKLVALFGAHENVEVIYCPRRSPSGGLAYRMRNEMMLDGATELQAFVTSADFYRSGEWMTINIAHKLGIPVHIWVLPR